MVKVIQEQRGTKGSIPFLTWRMSAATPGSNPGQSKLHTTAIITPLKRRIIANGVRNSAIFYWE